MPAYDFRFCVIFDTSVFAVNFRPKQYAKILPNVSYLKMSIHIIRKLSGIYSFSGEGIKRKIGFYFYFFFIEESFIQIN